MPYSPHTASTSLMLQSPAGFARMRRRRAEISLATNVFSPVNVVHFAPHTRQFLDDRVLGREVAHRVGRAGVAGEREGLAAAAAEILSAPRARRARLLHPVGTAEGAE